MEPYGNWTPGIVVPKFARDPLGDEGELTPGPDELNPATDPRARAYIEDLERKQREYARRDDQIASTVPNPRNPDLPPARVDDPTAGDDPYAFDDVDEEIDDAMLPGLGRTPDTELRFDTGGLFRF
jgi:hypothetical protein